MFSYDVVLTVIGIAMATLNIVALQFVSRARKDANRNFMNENGKLLGTTTSRFIFNLFKSRNGRS